MLPQQYCLRWKYHHSNLQSMFSQLLDRGCFCDVTIACGGQTLKAHRVVLCACSTYFDSLLTNCCTEKDPIIIMRDVKYSDVKCLIEFMYKGEINVEYSNLASLLKTAEELKIKGLAEVSWRDDETTTTNNNNNDISHNKNNTLLTNNNNNNNNPDDQEANRHSTISHLSHSYNQISNTNSSNNHNQKRQARSSSPTILPNTDNNMSFEHNSTSRNSSHPLPMLATLNSPKKTEHSGCGSPINYAGAKKKRGRPPLDEEYDTYASHAKVSHLDNSLHQYTDSSHLVTVMMDDNSRGETNREDTILINQQHRPRQHYGHDDEEDDDNDNNANHQSFNEDADDAERKQLLHNIQQFDADQIPAKMIPKLERPDTPMDYLMPEDDPSDQGSSLHAIFLTAQEQEEWRDVITMNEYLTKGRRPQFWDEPFTKRVYIKTNHNILILFCFSLNKY